jgi:hypothetical protein
VFRGGQFRQVREGWANGKAGMARISGQFG